MGRHDQRGRPLLARLRRQSYDVLDRQPARLVDGHQLWDEPHREPEPEPEPAELVVTSQVRLARDLEALRAEIAELRVRIRAAERGVA